MDVLATSRNAAALSRKGARSKQDQERGANVSLCARSRRTGRGDRHDREKNKSHHEKKRNGDEITRIFAFSEFFRSLSPRFFGQKPDYYGQNRIILII